MEHMIILNLNTVAPQSGEDTVLNINEMLEIENTLVGVYVDAIQTLLSFVQIPLIILFAVTLGISIIKPVYLVITYNYAEVVLRVAEKYKSTKLTTGIEDLKEWITHIKDTFGVVIDTTEFTTVWNQYTKLKDKFLLEWDKEDELIKIMVNELQKLTTHVDNAYIRGVIQEELQEKYNNITGVMITKLEEIKPTIEQKAVDERNKLKSTYITLIETLEEDMKYLIERI